MPAVLALLALFLVAAAPPAPRPPRPGLVLLPGTYRGRPVSIWGWWSTEPDGRRLIAYWPADNPHLGQGPAPAVPATPTPIREPDEDAGPVREADPGDHAPNRPAAEPTRDNAPNYGLLLPGLHELPKGSVITHDVDFSRRLQQRLPGTPIRDRNGDTMRLGPSIEGIPDAGGRTLIPSPTAGSAPAAIDPSWLCAIAALFGVAGLVVLMGLAARKGR